MTQAGRVLTAKGHKPVGVKDTTRESFYLYGSVEPDTGDAFLMEFERMSAQNFQTFLTAFGLAHTTGLHLMVVDGAAIHWAKSLVIPDNLVLIQLPAYCPELNPIERFWEELKRVLKWKNWPTLLAMKNQVWHEAMKWTNEQVQTLTSFPYILKVLLAI